MFKHFVLLILAAAQVIPSSPPAGVSPEVWASYKSIPTSNSDQKHFDVIIVLGVPTNPDGSIAPDARARMDEGIHEYRAGVAKHIIPTGGAAHNQFFEAHAMKEYAVSQGVPADAVIEEDQAKDTIQNIWFAYKIMEQHGWSSTEVVSDPSHLPRAALILEHYKGLLWRAQPSHWPAADDQAEIDRRFKGEAMTCWKLMHDGFGHNDDLPGGY
jgi:uncharacterized SAM-binding protein YcdF (DUF218 family)